MAAEPTEATSETKALEESSVTMLDVLEDEMEMENEYAAVLGGSDDKCCTYPQGPIKRQALYSCLTCCPDSRSDLSKCAGICLACSYRCHENHELVELYTKRNFRCDCPTERLGGNKCVLNTTLVGQQEANKDNLYNQNFQGLYCSCHRPYPDPERTAEEVMHQCVICEDWYHLQHLDIATGGDKLAEAADEMICGACMQSHAFIQDYTGLALKALEEADESLANITVTGDVSVCEESDNKLHSDLDKSISDIMNLEGGDKEPKPDESETAKNEGDDGQPLKKKAKVEATPEEATEEKVEEPAAAESSQKLCKRPTKKTDYVKGATFWTYDWRSALCRCDACQLVYKEQRVEYLLDAEDLSKTYEERGIKATESSYERGIKALASIDRVHQIDAITQYNVMKDRLKSYLQTFAASKKVVTEEDINRFFADIRSENKGPVHQPHFCR